MMTDPIADFTTHLRNASRAKHRSVSIRFSRIKQAIAEVMKTEGFIADFAVTNTDDTKQLLEITLIPQKVLTIRRMSKPGIRLYKSADALPRIKNDLGILILTTSHGVMSNKEARKRNIGGEVLCEVY